MSFSQFCCLNKVVPRSLQQAEQIMHTVEAFIYAHPELLREIQLFYRLERARIERNFDVLLDGIVKFREGRV